MKLELKQISPYLPYELKIFWHEDSLPVWDGMNIYNIDKVLDLAGKYENEDRWKPILRPLSDLWVEIPYDNSNSEYSGDTTIPIVRIGYLNKEQLSTLTDSDKNEIEDWIGMGSMYVTQYNTLLKMHFDIFGLIEKGLAININTLKQ